MSDATTTGQRPRRAGLLRRVLGRTEYFDFIGQSRKFLIVSVVLLAVVAIGGLLRGLNFSIEFTGGTALTITNASKDFTAEDLRDAVSDAGVEGALVQVVDGGDGALVSTPAVEEIGGEQQRDMVAGITEVTGAGEGDIAREAVGPRWGQQITQQSLRGLLVFLVLVALYLALRFEWRMAAAAIVTLVHDIVLTVGIYAIVGFPVSPASVIAFLTILGYSLYDTVVVFDRVGEDTARLSSVATKTYGETANEALNEVLVRSLSTSLTSLLPVGALLFIGANLLGAKTLQDLALALFIGMAVGTYSSIVVATPFLVWLKEKEPRWAELKQRVESRRGGADRDASAPAAVGSTLAQSRPAPRPRSSKSRAKRRR
ncbi:MAG: protein translocase subunit SecF [Nitriliruptorales bacterium]|nr:protein translocase subunit SecF [Nitriliruptorales bacterium]